MVTFVGLETGAEELLDAATACLEEGWDGGGGECMCESEVGWRVKVGVEMGNGGGGECV